MIYLKNEGEIDIEVIKTMGVNVKDNDCAIGFFGTGLKYAIATFLREGVDITLNIGENNFEFVTEEKVIRGKAFKFCKMISQYDSLDLGFTTELGKNWELWQAYREIHSNCLDENGHISEPNQQLKPECGYTLFSIDVDDSYKDVFLETQNSELLFKATDAEIYEGESQYIYYKGIRAMKLNKPSVHTYNIISYCELTEDRSISYSYQVEKKITNTIGQCEDKDIIHKAITASNDKYESTIDATWDTREPKQVFTEVAKNNISSVSSNFASYARQYEPEEPKTKEQLREDFIEYIQGFCEENEALFSLEDGQINITGGPLDDNIESEAA